MKLLRCFLCFPASFNLSLRICMCSWVNIPFLLSVFLFPSCLSACVCLCMSICLMIYLCLSIYPSIHLSIHLSIYLSIHLSIYHYLSMYLSVFFLSICMSVCISVCLSPCFSFFLFSFPSSVWRSLFLWLCDVQSTYVRTYVRCIPRQTVRKYVQICVQDTNIEDTVMWCVLHAIDVACIHSHTHETVFEPHINRLKHDSYDETHVHAHTNTRRYQT